MTEPAQVEQLDEDAREEGTTYRSSSKSLSADDVAECERFAAIAATFMLQGARARDAWSRANRWIDEHPDGQLPAGCLPVTDRPPIVTPKPAPMALHLLFPSTAVHVLPPAPVVLAIPRDRRMCGCGHEGSDHVAGGGCRICVRSKLGGACLQFHERRPRGAREIPMGDSTVNWQTRIIEELARGPKTRKELQEILGASAIQVRNATYNAGKAGRLVRDGKTFAIAKDAPVPKRPGPKPRPEATPSRGTAGRAGGRAAAVGRARAGKPTKTATAAPWLVLAREERDRLQARVKALDEVLERFAE